jgi:hypothetical protein
MVAASLFLGLVLACAAVAKLLHWTAFRGVVGSYRLLPEWLVVPFASILPPVEFALGVSVALRVAMPWAGFFAAALLLLFAIAMAVNLARGRTYIDCGCFQSALRQSIGWHLVARNCVLAGLAVMVAASASYPTQESLLWLPTILAAVTFYALYLAINSIWALEESGRNAFAQVPR